MDPQLRGRASVPTRQAQSSAQPQGEQSNASRAFEPQRTSAPGSKKKIGIIVGVIIALALAGLLGWTLLQGGAPSGVKSNQYQAVFLSNGQVYFGKLTSVNDNRYVLEDIYYLQQQQDVQSQENDEAAQDPELSLAKLGSELHGPESEMFISADQVLFWENLTDESQVVAAIKENAQSQQ